MFSLDVQRIFTLFEQALTCPNIIPKISYFFNEKRDRNNSDQLRQSSLSHPAQLMRSFLKLNKRQSAVADKFDETR